MLFLFIYTRVILVIVVFCVRWFLKEFNSRFGLKKTNHRLGTYIIFIIKTHYYSNIIRGSLTSSCKRFISRALSAFSSSITLVCLDVRRPLNSNSARCASFSLMADSKASCLKTVDVYINMWIYVARF